MGKRCSILLYSRGGAISWLSGFLVIFLVAQASAQEKCGTISNRTEATEQFEEWLQRSKLDTRRSGFRTDPYTIPVVVHVIHNGEKIGSGVNISDEQIRSQIEVLNEDFNRTNSDAAETPSAFQQVAGSIPLNFVLALRDPDGNATTGIVRVEGSKSSWSFIDEVALKAKSYWPAEDYLNIWVTDLSSTLLGYAQFPVSNLSGLEFAEDDRLTDGVVVDYMVFGSRKHGSFNLLQQFNNGRTATHEIGHFLGLRHIWGDDGGSCSGRGDYVDDTPNQADNTNGCPAHPQTTCNAHAMFQNYMDYTNDGCMNLFTNGQVSRMETVINNSPRRASLTKSLGATAPIPAANDIQLLGMTYPTVSICAGDVTPAFQIRNAGTSAITSAIIEYSLNGAVNTKQLTFSEPLESLAETIIHLDPMAVVPGSNKLNVKVLTVNGAPDERAFRNSLEAVIKSPAYFSLPATERFDVKPASWSAISTSSNSIAWSVNRAPRDSQTNKALYMGLFSTAERFQPELLFSPAFHLPADGSPYLIFDLSYPSPTFKTGDALEIRILEDCSDDTSSGTTVFFRKGNELATTAAASRFFVPVKESDWKREAVDLSAFKGKSNLRFVVIATNGGGNNIYMDNFTVVSDVGEDVAISSALSPTPAVCVAPSIALIEVTNKGQSTVESVRVRAEVNQSESASTTFAALSLQPGEDVQLSIPITGLKAGENSIVFSLTEPNGVFDINDSDNQKTVFTFVNDASDIIPLREDFNDEVTWGLVVAAGPNKWHVVQTNYDHSMHVESSLGEAQTEAWLVTPSLDFTESTKASLFFDVFQSKGVTYESNAVITDQLKILASIDCGDTYFEVHSENSILSAAAATRLSPAAEADWTRRYISLASVTGHSSVRVAFVFLTSGQTNIYLDNIEFFNSDVENPFSAAAPFEVYGTDPSTPQDFYITFNLENRKDVTYELMDLQGRVVTEERLENVLNQTVHVVPHLPAGIYYLRVHIGSDRFTSRIFLNQ